MTADHPDAERRSYTTFGWEGITLTVPSDWILLATHGKREDGYVRLGDGQRARLELRWEKTGSTAEPAVTVSSYLAKLRKTARKDGVELTVQRDLGLASPVGKQVECYRWVGDRQGLAMLSRCGDCRRTVHVQLLGRPEEKLKNLARTVFASLQDHADDDAELWKFYDVEFRVPGGLPLRTRSLQTGCVRMIFGGRRERLEFVRASLARLVLADQELEEWFRDFYRARLKWRRYQVEDARIKGHSGLRIEGHVGWLANPLGLLGWRRMLRAACWHCTETNRLMICAYEGRRAEPEIFEPALESFTCC
ncbi:MAG: hypothetical protein R6V05_06720 [Candidatus Brocadiia bacterium]